MDKDIYKLAKDFFGFGENPKRIVILVPGKERPRDSFTFERQNYPLFEHFVFPDDLYSAIRVYSLLEGSYPGVVEVDFAYNRQQLPDSHRVLIGGPATNPFVYAATRHCPIHFDADPDVRILYGPNNRKYEIDEDGAMIKADYCLVSKRTVNKKVEFVIGGLRAYGQMGSDLFLSQEEFYKRLKGVSRNRDFQVVVRLDVSGKATTDWRIVYPGAFLCHAAEDNDKVRAVAASLEEHGISVWFYEGEVRPTKSIIQNIEKALDHSRYLVAFLSPSFFNSKWCLQELDYFLHKYMEEGEAAVEEVPLILLEIEPCDTPDIRKLPWITRNLNRLSTYTEDWLNTLVQSLKE